MTILLIDLSGICHAAYHVSTSDPNPDATSIASVAKVRALASGQPHVAVCIDTGRSFRRDVDPSYKANRPEQDGALKHQMALTIETLKQDGFPIWGAAGFEADDVIASSVALALGHTLPDDVLVCSSDKDLLQLVADRVQVKSLTNGTVYDAAAVFEKFQVAPMQMNDYLCLVGDASDNVKGAVGIGAKTAAKLLNTFGNLTDLYAAMDRGEAALTPAVTASLTAFRERWPTVRELITLRRDVAVPFTELFTERVPADVAVFGDEGEMMAETETDLAGSNPAPVAGTGEVPQVAALPESPSGPSTAPSSPAGATSPAATGLAVREPEVLPAPVEWERQLEPRSFNQTLQLGNVLHKSRLFSAYGSAEAVASTIMAGRELGIPAMASLRAFHIIENRPCMAADAIRSRAEADPNCEYFRCTERTDDAATFETKHRKHPEPTKLRYTIEDGKRAFSSRDQKTGDINERAWQASGWGRNPADMCVARASAKLARLVYPGQVHGFFAVEEFDNGR